MELPIPIIVEVKKRGNVTIPDTTRRVFDIHEGSVLVLKLEEVINKKEEEKNKEKEEER